MKTSTSPLLHRTDHTLEALAVRRRLAWPLLALLLPLLASAGWAATRTVTSLADSGSGSLRETIAASAAGDTIEFAVSGTITLTSGELTNNRTLNINGPGPANLTVSGNRVSRVFRIVSGSVTISGLTITEGRVFGLNGADGVGGMPAQPGTAGQGGAIFNGDDLTLVNCFVVGNLAQGGTGGDALIGANPGLGASGGPAEGGGVYNVGSLTVSNSTFYQNECVGGNGGMGIGATSGTGGRGGLGGVAGGGGIYNVGTLMLLNSTFTENRASGGVGGHGGNDFTGGAGGAGGSAFGGVYGFSGGAVNSTISGNTATGGSGGAGGNSVIGGNGAPGVTGSGEVGGVEVRSLASAIMINTIVAGNNGFYPDVSGSVMSQGHNLIGKTNGSSGWVASDITGSIASPRDPQLRPLQDVGGPTRVIPLDVSSPAIDAGDDVVLGMPFFLTTDQRGAARRISLHVDIGAFEFDPPPSFPGRVQFASAAYSVAEEADTVLITVLRSLGTSGVVRVDYATSDGTATTPSDYAAASGTLVFANGELSKTFSIRINNDGSLEGSEEFYLTLSSPSNTVVVSPGTAQVTILDNDRPQRLVTTFNDSGGGSLRQAIAIANSGDLILFAPVVRGTIRLTSGELLIDKPLSILGPGAAALAISGNTNSRVFHIGPQGNVDIYALTITEGRVVGTNGIDGVITWPLPPGPGGFAPGGGVFNEGSLRIFDSMIVSNSVQGGRGGKGVSSDFCCSSSGADGGPAVGAGIYSAGLLELNRCTLTGNRALGGDGGSGGDERFGSAATASGTGGYASGAGANAASASLESCTVAANLSTGGQGGRGAQLFAAPFYGVGGPGGLAAGGGLSGELALTDCSVSGNSVAGGMGGTGSVAGAIGETYAGGVNELLLSVQTTIIAGNTGSATSPDVDGAVTSQGWNLIGITDGSSGWTTNDFLGNSVFPLSALLGPCQDNGGPVWTMCPLSGSPARDKGRSDLATDARGGRRIVDFGSLPNAPGGDGSDIGALEVDSLFRIISITKSDSFARVKFKTDPGNTYRLQQTSLVTNRVWTNIVGTVTGNGQNLEATNFAPLPDTRFYRVRAD